METTAQDIPSLNTHLTRPQLPPELFDHIIDYLYDSPSDLRTCALVCKTWVGCSRFHLFRTVSIYPCCNLIQCHRLYSAIRRSPSIALCIRELTFSMHDDKSSSRTEWSLFGSVLPSLLRSLTGLRKLELHGIEWTSLTADVRKSLRDILALPSLIHFETMDAYFSRLRHFTSLLRPHLKRLTMCFDWGHEDARTRACCVVDGEIEKEAMVGRPPCRLEYLKFPLWFRNSDFIDWLLGSQLIVDISNLRTLDTWFDDKDSLMRLFRRLGSSLEHLTIRDLDIYDWDGTMGDCIDLGYQQNLQTLFLKARFQTGTASYLACMLSRLVAPKLQEISFSFWFPTYDCARNETDWSDLAEIDRILGSRAFDLLRSIRISFQPRSSLGPIQRAIDVTIQSPTTTPDFFQSTVESALSSPKSVHSGNIDKIRRKFVNHFPLLISKGILEVRGDNVLLI